MLAKSGLLIRTGKFPVMPGEEKELVNERMYGKALCRYLEDRLPGVGIGVSFYCNEDWGWWIEVNLGSFKLGLCIYSDPSSGKDPEYYAILPSIQKTKKWSWSKFQFVDVSQDVMNIMILVERVLREDVEILVVARIEDYPF